MEISRLFYLIGPPGSGKRTIGRELAALAGAVLIDNHLVNDPVFVALGGNSFRQQWPRHFPELVEQIYATVMEAARLAPAGVSHIFTNYLADDPGELRAITRLRDLAGERGVPFVLVNLSCPTTRLPDH